MFEYDDKDIKITKISVNSYPGADRINSIKSAIKLSFIADIPVELNHNNDIFLIYNPEIIKNILKTAGKD